MLGVECNHTDITSLSIHFGLLPAALANTAAIEAKEGRGTLAVLSYPAPISCAVFPSVSVHALPFTSASVCVSD